MKRSPVAALRKLAAKADGVRQGVIPVSPQAQEELARLCDGYEQRRQGVDPGYRLSRAMVQQLQVARKRLLARWVRPDQWEGYLDWLFGRCHAITGGQLAVPPGQLVASENQIDSYVATLGPRQLDPARARSRLAQAGYGELHAGVVVSITTRAIQAGGQIPQLEGEQAEQYAKACQWLLEHADEIGYVERQGGACGDD